MKRLASPELVPATVTTSWAARPDAATLQRSAAKRGFDLVVGTILTILTLPILLGLALASTWILREVPFFVQERIGQDGRRIPFIKIRTLSSRRVSKYALKQDFGAGDVHPFMQTIRKLHLDEVPQLWLVVMGHLSLVGPRPKMPDEVEPVEADYGTARVSVPQGCTCLWQIGEHTNGLPSDSPQYDYQYLLHGGLRLDLWILAWTGLQMVGIGSPKTLEDAPAWARSRGWAAPTTENVPAGVRQVVRIHPPVISRAA